MEESGKLSDYTMAKNRSEWDRLCVHMVDATSMHPDPSKIWEWQVCVRSHTHLVGNLNWSCTCGFYTSTILPCKHIMFVARDCQKFSILPATVIPDRWCMRNALKLLPVIENTTTSLLHARDLAKWRPGQFHAATNTATNAATDAEPKMQAETGSSVLRRAFRSPASARTC